MQAVYDRGYLRRLEKEHRKEQKRIRDATDQLKKVCRIFTEDMKYVTAVWNK